MAIGKTRGIKCPKCGAWTIVLESRPDEQDNIIYRHRECGNLHRFHSKEVLHEGPIPRRARKPLEKETNKK